jgi:hypothetical protein
MSARRPRLLALALLAACSRPPPPPPSPAPAQPAPAPAEASPAPAGADAPPVPGATGDAAAPAPAPPPDGAAPAAGRSPAGPVTAAALVREAVVLRAAGDPTALSTDAETVVEPDARFRVTLGAESRDARLLLLDAADAIVPSTASHAIGDETELTLSPTDPLVPGSRYRLRVDGAVGRELHAGDRAYAPALYALRVAGEPPPPLPSPKRRAKGKKHR